MSEYQMGLHSSYAGVDLNSYREDDIFESLGSFQKETSFESSQGSNVFCQTQFNDIGYEPNPLDMLTFQPELVAPAGDQHSSGSCMSDVGMSMDEIVSMMSWNTHSENVYNASQAMNGNLFASDFPFGADGNLVYGTQQESYPDGFSSSNVFLDASQGLPTSWLPYPYSVASTPGFSASPSSSEYSMSLSPVEGHFLSVQLPTLEVPIKTSASRSPTPLLFDSPPAPSSHLTPTVSNASSQRRTRSSISEAARLASRHRPSARSSQVPCTVRGCTKKFFDKRTRDRHVASIHDRASSGSLGHVCPGMCRKEGFSREDALNRHLLYRGERSECQVEARKLGWSPRVKGSVQLLRNFCPPV